jgi:hypothetical protein
MFTEYIKNIFEILFDESKTTRHKISLFFLTIFLLVITDLCFHITYNIHINNKLNIIERIDKIKNIYAKDTILLMKITSIENSIMKQKHYTEVLSSVINKGIVIQNGKSKVDVYSKIKNERSFFLMIISSNYLLLIILPFVIILPLFDLKNSNLYTFVGWFSAIMILIIIILFTTFTAYLIPQLFTNPFWNYLLNFTIHTTFWILLYKLLKKTKNDPSLKTKAKKLILN